MFCLESESPCASCFRVAACASHHVLRSAGSCRWATCTQHSLLTTLAAFAFGYRKSSRQAKVLLDRWVALLRTCCLLAHLLGKLNWQSVLQHSSKLETASTWSVY